MPGNAAGATLSLFPEDQLAPNERDKKLMQVMDKLNDRHGRGTVRLASENSAGWRHNQERLSPCCTTRWGDIMVGKG